MNTNTINETNAMDNAPANQIAPVVTNPANPANPASFSSTSSQLLSTKLASLGENLGEFKPYNSANVPVEIAGTRIVKCLYRADNTTGLESSYCRIPTAHLSSSKIADKANDLSEHVANWLESVEDKQIKAAHGKGQLNIFTTGLSIDSLIAYLEETTEGGRLTKEKIAAWFNVSFEAPLSEIVANKLGVSLLEANENQLVNIQRVVNAYKSKFELFASPKASIKTEDMEAMRKAINLCGLLDDSLASRFMVRMDKIEAASKDALFAL